MKTRYNRAVPIGDRTLQASHRHPVVHAKWKLLTGEQYGDQGLIFAAATRDIMQAENLPHRLFRPVFKVGEPRQIG